MPLKPVVARYEALGDGLFEALEARRTAQSPGETNVARHALGYVVRGICEAMRNGTGCAMRRGPKLVYDREWANDNLLEMIANDLDGLPERQTVLVDRLRLRFKDAGKAVPGDTWLKKIVGQFYARSLIREREAREKWVQSWSLQETFSTADDFIAFTRTRDRLEQKWLNDKALQHHYLRPGDYVASVLAQRESIAASFKQSSKSQHELATFSG